MVSKDHDLSQRRQFTLLQLSRSTLYYQPKGESAENLRFMKIIDKQFLETPWYGSSQLARHMKRQGHKCVRRHAVEADFCVSALKEALATYGPPEIFNADQRSQITTSDWVDEFKEAKVKISMDGKGRWIGNRMIERLWRSLKYECVYLQAFETGS